MRYSLSGRYRHVASLPPDWEGQDGLLLRPEMLVPEKHQVIPDPVDVDPDRGPEGVFSTIFPYHRVPWLPGIVGCPLQVSTVGQTVWTRPCLAEDWYQQDDLGLTPRMEWLDKLLEFVRYLVRRQHEHDYLTTVDMIARGVGDLSVNMLGPERLYVGLHDHPAEVKRLLTWIADIHIEWANAQWEITPPVFGGYCNQNGIWSPGRCTRFQEDLACNISERTFFEFLAPCEERIIDAFPYQVLHTHSGVPALAQWALRLERLKAVEVTIDPHGPSVEESIPLWIRILEKKPLILSGPVSRRQLDLLVKRLPPSGLLLDSFLVTEEELHHRTLEFGDG
ncbi:MAG: hypothetical protein HYY04_10530 [Chloroflexi bacterium]|nr:hypothetical protein [Chloroflexota bacterium]